MKSLLFSLLFILPLVAQNGNTDHVVLCELFSSTTCPPCRPANQAFDLWLSRYAYKDRVAVIKYHVWWPSPGNDPFYLANTNNSLVRNTLYGNQYAPNMYVDGSNGGYTYSTWPFYIEGNLNIALDFSITMKGVFNGDTLILTIDVTHISAAVPAGGFSLHTVLTESELYYTGPNGDPKHDHVMRKMYPSAEGESFTISAGGKKSFTRTIPISSGWNKNNCSIVAFVQNSATNTVHQTAFSSITSLTSIRTRNEMLPISVVLEQNYPNPFNPSTTIRYGLPNTSHVTVRVYTVLGQLVDELVNAEQQEGWHETTWNANEASGLYLYRIDVVNSSDPEKQFTQFRKMTLIK